MPVRVQGKVRRHRQSGVGAEGTIRWVGPFAILTLGVSDDSDWQVPLRCGSLGKLGAAHRYPRMLVPGLSVLGRRQRNGWRLLSHGDVQGYGKDTRLFEHRG